MRLFFEFSFVAKRSPFKFFDILQQTEVSKSPKGLPFQIFRHYETFKILIFFPKISTKKFSNFFKCLQRPSFIFLIFCNKLDFRKAEIVPPFTILKTLRFLSLRYSADFRRSRLVFYPHELTKIVLKCFTKNYCTKLHYLV